MTVDMPVCYLCKNKNREDLTCPAFPDGIPDKIILEGDPHKKPFPNQGNGIAFEAKDDESLKLYREHLKDFGL